MDTLRLRIRNILLEEFSDDVSIEDIDAVQVKADYTRIADRIINEIGKEIK